MTPETLDKMAGIVRRIAEQAGSWTPEVRREHYHDVLKATESGSMEGITVDHLRTIVLGLVQASDQLLYVKEAADMLSLGMNMLLEASSVVDHARQKVGIIKGTVPSA